MNKENVFSCLIDNIKIIIRDEGLNERFFVFFDNLEKSSFYSILKDNIYSIIFYVLKDEISERKFLQICKEIKKFSLDYFPSKTIGMNDLIRSIYKIIKDVLKIDLRIGGRYIQDFSTYCHRCGDSHLNPYLIGSHFKEGGFEKFIGLSQKEIFSTSNLSLLQIAQLRENVISNRNKCEEGYYNLFPIGVLEVINNIIPDFSIDYYKIRDIEEKIEQLLEEYILDPNNGMINFNSELDGNDVELLFSVYSIVQDALGLDPGNLTNQDFIKHVPADLFSFIDGIFTRGKKIPLSRLEDLVIKIIKDSKSGSNIFNYKYRDYFFSTVKRYAVAIYGDFKIKKDGNRVGFRSGVNKIYNPSRLSPNFNEKMNGLYFSNKVKRFIKNNLLLSEGRTSTREFPNDPLSGFFDSDLKRPSKLKKLTGNNVLVTHNGNRKELKFSDKSIFKKRKIELILEWIKKRLITVVKIRDSQGIIINDIDNTISDIENLVVKDILTLLVSKDFEIAWRDAKDLPDYNEHDFINFYIQKHSRYSLNTENLVWAFSFDGSSAISGHIDHILGCESTIIVADSKPGEHLNIMNSDLQNAIFRSLPQVISYSLMLKQMMERQNIEISEVGFQNIIFNSDCLIYYNPMIMIDELYRFYIKFIIEFHGNEIVTFDYVMSQLKKLDFYTFFPPTSMLMRDYF